MHPKVVIKPGREKAIRQRHPWVFSGAISKLPKCDAGEIVDVVDEKNNFLARGYCNAKSQIQVRLLSWDESEKIDREFFFKKILSSYERKKHLLKCTNAIRIVHGESDGIPGLILDLYNEVAVMQILTAGMEYQRQIIIDVVKETLKVKTIVDRSDEAVRELEGLSQRLEVVSGNCTEEDFVEIHENGLRLKVSPIKGHKTGYYLDQRDNRLLVRSFAKDAAVLNCFSYTGGFGVSAALGGAKSVLQLDASSSALELAQEHHKMNGCEAPEIICGDAFEELRNLQRVGRKFDLIIMDPPKLASNKNQVDKACRGYKDLNLSAFKLLNPGGRLFTYSCSGLISLDLFQKVVFSAALDAKVDARILKVLSQSEDHPTSLYFPEGFYLKGFLIQT